MVQFLELIPSLLTHCMTLGKSPNLSGSQAALSYTEVRELDPGFNPWLHMNYLGNF